MRILPMIKETYHEVGENEYQQINPYIEAIGIVRTKYPKAKIKRFKTQLDVLYGVQFPMLLTYFEVGE